MSTMILVRPKPIVFKGFNRDFLNRLLKVVFITNVRAQARLTDMKTAIDAGTAAVIQIYSGSVPTDADTALGAQVLLATLTMNATAFGAVSDAAPGAIMTAAAITPDTSCDATGTAAFFRILTQAAGTVLIQGAVAASGSDMNFNTVSFTITSQIDISSMTITDPES